MSIPEDQVESGTGVRDWVTATFYGKDAMEVTVKIKNYHDEYPVQGYTQQILHTGAKVGGPSNRQQRRQRRRSLCRISVYFVLLK